MSGSGSPSHANEEAVWEVLKGVRFPGMSRDIVSFGFVKQVGVEGGAVRIRLAITTQNRAAADQVQADVERAVSAIPGVQAVTVEYSHG